MTTRRTLTSLEICAGGGGQALGLEMSGFQHLGLVENDRHACATLRRNRPNWKVFEKDVRAFVLHDAEVFRDKVDLLAGGVPCPPFSVAGRQLGRDDERDLFPVALQLVEILKPRAVMLENVRGLLQLRFDEYRAEIDRALRKLGYASGWRLLQASDFGVPQLRPRVVCVAIESRLASSDPWNTLSLASSQRPAPTVGECLVHMMSAAGWKGAAAWAGGANLIAPTLVGGSKKHGGADLGPTRAKRAWAELGVDGGGLADAPPPKSFKGAPRLTLQMAAALQGFPSDWVFVGGKTNAYRQVGNAFPPPVAAAVGAAIRAFLRRT